jgi:O-antigen/teichoic acid export membrane protein
MRDKNNQNIERQSKSGIIGRFLSLLSAQGVDGIASSLFFLYLAWINSSDYGQIMYALAAGGIVFTVIQFGLYYPLVSELGASPKEQCPAIINRVLIIKLGLLIPAMLGVSAIAWHRNLSWELFWVLMAISAGFGAEAVAETFFADLRVRGFQSREARIKVFASLMSYVYAFAVAAIALGPVVMSLFKLISSLIRIGLALSAYVKDYSASVFRLPQWSTLRKMFGASLVFALIEILGTIYNKINVFYLEKVTGVTGVAYYSATWNIVDSVSMLGSEQLLGWVIFPLLASIWWNQKQEAYKLVRSNAQWLMALAFPIIFVLSAESSLIIGVVYPQEYKDAIWMQQYLAWTILLSFENNLFSYVMIVAGSAKLLLGIQFVATVFNLAFNHVLVGPLGLQGGCLVIILTKLVAATLTFSFCRFSLRIIAFKDFLLPIALALFLFVGHALLSSFINFHVSVVVILSGYVLLLIQLGPRIMGPLPGLKKLH